MRSRMVIVMTLAAGVILSGCATRGWVRDEMGKQTAQTDAKLGQHAQRVEGMGFRLEKVAERTEVVDQRLTRLWSKRHLRDHVDSLDVSFRFGRWDLDDGAQTALIGLVRELQANPTLTVDLAGYTDPAGGLPYNIGLSQRRVEAVRRFLVQQGVELPRVQAIGLGVLNDRALPAAQKRRVTVRLMTPTE